MKECKSPRILAVVLLCLLALTACSPAKYKDGTYFATMPEFASSGWKDTVELTVENGEVAKINWDSVYKNDSVPIRKKQYSKSGLYGMLRAGAIDEWYDQAIAAEQYVLENGVDAIRANADGKTDAITGCTIDVSGFEQMVRECLRQAER